MRSFELGIDGQVMAQAVPIYEQPVREPEMQPRPSPILSYIMGKRMESAMLFGQQILPRPNPFSMPELPDGMKPRFDASGGQR